MLELGNPEEFTFETLVIFERDENRLDHVDWAERVRVDKDRSFRARWSATSPAGSRARNAWRVAPHRLSQNR